MRKLISPQHGKGKELTLPQAVIFRAFKDLSHPDPLVVDDAKAFLLSGGGIWGELTGQDTKTMYEEYTGE